MASCSALTPAPVVWMNGLPGVGKLTIAECLVGLIGFDKAVLFESHRTDYRHQSFSDGMSSPHHALAPKNCITRTKSEEQLRRRKDIENTIAAEEFLHKIIILTDCELLPPTVEAHDDKTLLSSSSSSSSSSYHIHRETANMDEKETAIHNEFQNGTAADATDSMLSDGRIQGCRFAAVARTSNRPFLSVYLTCREDEHIRRIGSLERRSSRRGKISSPEHARQLRRQHGLLVLPGTSAADETSPSMHLDITSMEAHQAAIKILSFARDEMYRPRPHPDGLSAGPAADPAGTTPSSSVAAAGTATGADTSAAAEASTKGGRLEVEGWTTSASGTAAGDSGRERGVSV